MSAARATSAPARIYGTSASDTAVIPRKRLKSSTLKVRRCVILWVIIAATIRASVCLRETSVKKANKACSLSPPSGAPRRIGAVADEERSRSQFD